MVFQGTWRADLKGSIFSYEKNYNAVIVGECGKKR